MRETCRDCARKHLAQAIILAIEERTGYPQFKWLVVGHIAEAEAELVELHPDVANELREFRKEYEIDTSVNMPLMGMITKITQLDDAAKEPKEEPKRKKR
jgi:hypothetical protein